MSPHPTPGARIGAAAGGPPYYESLTLLRGVAALGVCGYHLTVAYRAGDVHPHPLLALGLPLFSRGWFGVDLFFLIGGYGLASKLAGRSSQGFRAAAAFAVNRFWRIFPLYWCCTVLVLLLALAASRFNHLDARSAFPTTSEGWYATVFLVGPWVGSEPVIPVVSWALSLEVGVYLVAAGALVLRTWCHDAFLVGAATLVALANLAGWRPVFETLFTHWPEFVAGALTFAAVRGRWRGQREFLLPVGGIALLLLVAALQGPPRVAATLGIALGLVWAWSWDEQVARHPACCWILWCGRISFPLFLLHVPVAMRVTNLAARVIPRESLAFAGVLLVAFGTVLALAWVVHRWIELPFLAVARSHPDTLLRST